MKKVSISLFAMVMLMTGAVDGIRNLPAIAIFGEQLVFFFIAAMFLFLLPTGLISAELCKQFKQEGGVYVWAKSAFGGGVASLVIWLQWINTMVWFPTSLSALIGTVAYLINPSLVQHPLFLVLLSVSVFWVMTLINLKGIQHSSKIAAIASSLGMVVPMCIIIGLSLFWVILHKPLAITLDYHAVVPPLNSIGTWSSLTAIMGAFLGIELATVHVKKINNADKLFPRALMIAVVIIVLTMGFGSLGVALVIPHQSIVIVSGTIQAIKALFVGFHVPWLADVVGGLLVLGSLGAMINWLISPANGLAQAARGGYLPKRLGHENRHGVPSNILILQAIVVSVVSTGFFLLPTINASYWLLFDLATEAYLLMYVLMFLTAVKVILRAKTIYLVPGGKVGALVVSVLGLVGCLIALVVGFFPPSNINVGSSLHYVLFFGLGVLIMCIPAVGLNIYKYVTSSKL